VTRLIVNADDFGFTYGVNQSILDLHKAGALSSATMMAVASHTPAAAGIATLNPSLGVGCHVVLVDGKPTLPLNSLRELVLPSGSFRPTLRAFVVDVTRGSIPEIELEIEATAQIRRLQGLGIRISHVDTHKHTHMFPQVLRPLLRAAVGCGIRAIRNPFEPSWALRATPHAPILRRIQVRLLRRLQKEFLQLVDKAGLATTDGSIGVLATGTLNAEALHSILNAMPAGTWELVCHPGYVDETLNRARTRLKKSREVERTALLEVIPQFLRDHPDVSLINFRQTWKENA
jgi:predicted glycoside hydrolase/deacetylase ChbG (UPF0249 family)